MFYKISFKKIHNIYRKETVLESLLNKFAGLMICNFIKKDSSTSFSSEFCQIFKTIFSTAHLWRTVSEYLQQPYQPAFTCSKLIIEILKQGVKCVQRFRYF